MTHPLSDQNLESEPKAQSFYDWFHINQRLVSAGAGIVVVALLGFWFVQRTRMNEAINSDRQLLLAKTSLHSGNDQLGIADLRKVVDKYGNKPAGAEAGMLIATTQMEKGDYKSAIAGLKDLVGRAPTESVASVHALLGSALSQSGQPAEAAAEYDKAAASTEMVLERTSYEAEAARAYLSAGKPGDAKRRFEALATQSDYPAIQAEARVRLGELSVASKP